MGAGAVLVEVCHAVLSVLFAETKQMDRFFEVFHFLLTQPSHHDPELVNPAYPLVFFDLELGVVSLRIQQVDQLLVVYL